VVLAAVAPGVAHIAYFDFVEVREFVLFGLRAEAKFVNLADNFAEIIAALNLFFDFAEDFADFVFDRVGTGGLLLKGVQIGKSLVLTKSRRSSPIRARLWSILPSLPLGAAQTSQR
jgi:hypothetical protein